jgi:hypothetical protein
MTRWHQLIDFSEKTGVKIAFGLNAMVRANNSAPSNLSNHEAFLAYTASRNLVRQVYEERKRVLPDVACGGRIKAMERTILSYANFCQPSTSDPPLR